MKRVAVVGSGGSGKSYVAREIGRILGLQVTHLGAICFDDAWNRLPVEEFAARQRELAATPTWVIDGNYNSTLEIRLEACDTVVFVDVPTVTALWGVLSRQLRYGYGHHGNGIHNRLTWEFLRYVATYRKRMRPRVLRKIHEHSDTVDFVVLKSRRQVRRWLQGLS